MKKWSFVIITILFFTVVVFFLLRTDFWKTMSMSADELGSSIEIVDVDTKWVDKYYHPWPPKLILVPAISFKVKNVSEKPLTYINFNAVFRFRDDFENLGDSYFAAIQGDPILPGRTSDEILLKSNYGVEGRSLASFKDNPHWKVALVQLFADSKGSHPIKLGEWEVSKTIDFKEPEDIEIKKSEDKPAGKK